MENGTYVRSWLATGLIARGLYKETKIELGRSKGNIGPKGKNQQV